MRIDAMRLATKSILWVLSAAVFVLLGFAIFLTAVGDTFYRRLARQVVEQAIDHDVWVDGKFSLDLGMEPTLVVTGLRVENAPWAQSDELARIDRIEVQVALQPLLSGIVLVPRLILEGVRLDFETAPDGRRNWAAAARDNGPEGEPGDVFYPLLEFISLKDVAITYRDRERNWYTELILHSLDKTPRPDDGSFIIAGTGRLNDEGFEIDGQFGAIEDALAAKAPYPLALSVTSPSLKITLAGTAANLPHGEGFDLELNVTAPAIGELLAVWNLDRTAEGSAEINARVLGDFAALSVEHLAVELIGRAGQRWHAQGSIKDLVAGNGLNLRFGGNLVPASAILGVLPAALREIRQLELAGCLTGRFETPIFEDLALRGTHASGAELALTGRVALDLSADRIAPTDMAISGTLSLPGPMLLAQLLGTELPDFGPLKATAAAAVTDKRVELSSLRLTLADFGGLEVRAHGPIGQAVPDAPGIAFDPELTFTAAMGQSHPLFSLADTGLPEMGPVRASGLLTRTDGAFHVADLKAALGSKERTWFEVDGELGPIRLDREEPIERLAVTVRFGWPSSTLLAQLLGQDIPEMGAATGSVVVTGNPNSLSLSKLKIATRSDDGLVSGATGSVATIALNPSLTAEGLDLELEVRSETTQTIAQLAGRPLPELGPVRAKARLMGQTSVLALTDIVVSAGPPEAPLVELAGRVNNVQGRSGIALRGKFEITVARLFEAWGQVDGEFPGKIRGEFDLSDADGSFGFESVTAEIIDSDLVVATAQGVFDNIAERDDLTIQMSLQVPKPSTLGRLFGLAGPDFKPVAFEGRLSGSDEAFRVEGKAKVGQTTISSELTGRLTGHRPAIRGWLESPVFYFADFGLTPDVDDTEPQAPPTPQAAVPGSPQRIFSDGRLPFEILKLIDLDLNILLDDLDGASLHVDKAEARVVLQDGVLTIDPLLFTFVGGNVRLGMVVDAQSEQPSVRLSGIIDDLDLGDLFGQFETNVPLDGSFESAFNIRGEGDSLRALATSATGEIDVVVSRGRIRTSAFAFTALTIWSGLFAQSTRRGYSELNCFVMQLDFADGRGEFENFLLDTTNVRASGEGHIDLNQESLRIDINPQPKQARFVTFTTPFSIVGPLARPSLQVSVGGAAARTVGELVLTPINFFGNLLLLVNDQGEDPDNPCLKL